MGISQTSARVKRKARRDHDARLRGASTLVALAAESSSDSASTVTTGDSVTPTDTPVSDSSTAQLPQLPPGARRAKRARATGAQIVADVDVPQQEWPPLAATRAPRARPRHRLCVTTSTVADNCGCSSCCGGWCDACDALSACHYDCWQQTFTAPQASPVIRVATDGTRRLPR